MLISATQPRPAKAGLSEIRPFRPLAFFLECCRCNADCHTVTTHIDAFCNLCSANMTAFLREQVVNDTKKDGSHCSGRTP